MSTILEVTHLTRNFGGLAALSDVNLHLDSGELVGLIGPNGAGKTTVFNLLTGVYPPSRGSIVFSPGATPIDLGGRKPYAICRAGLARTFQNIRLFKDLTVLDNVVIAMQQAQTYSLWDSFLHTPRWRAAERAVCQRSTEFLKLLNLEAKATELARNLAYGEQRHLEIARALATDPRLLLLDEPAAGMNPNETAQLTRLIDWIRQTYDLTILLIEHDMSLVMSICERIHVLDHGVVIAVGSPDEIRNDPRVIEAYLGEEVDDVRDL